MPRQSTLTLARTAIIDHFAAKGARVYSDGDIADELANMRAKWKLAARIGEYQIIGLLIEAGGLHEHNFYNEEYGRSIRRYAWDHVTALELAATINRRGYFSHGTAAALHGLTKAESGTLIFNIEQSAKPTGSTLLSQHNLDVAFARQQRQSKMQYKHLQSEITIQIVNGKHTDRLSVGTIIENQAAVIQSTDITRTLVDIVVRPAYAGGLPVVIEAYRAAKGRVSAQSILSTLNRLDYVYPYHQSIGFLLQATGHAAEIYEPFKTLGLNFNFYLAHGLQKPALNEEWRVFYPPTLSF